jgi:hypothetical protein
MPARHHLDQIVGDTIMPTDVRTRRERALAADNVRTRLASLNTALARAADLGLTVDIRQIPSGGNRVSFTATFVAEFLPITWRD